MICHAGDKNQIPSVSLLLNPNFSALSTASNDRTVILRTLSVWLGSLSQVLVSLTMSPFGIVAAMAHFWTMGLCIRFDATYLQSNSFNIRFIYLQRSTTSGSFRCDRGRFCRSRFSACGLSEWPPRGGNSPNVCNQCMRVVNV
jgi:hypothetical protein